jgi:hypothetical protein
MSGMYNTQNTEGKWVSSFKRAYTENEYERMCADEAIEGMEHYYGNKIASLRRSFDKMFSEGNLPLGMTDSPYCGCEEIFMRGFAKKANGILEDIALAEQCLNALVSLSNRDKVFGDD